MNNTLAVVLGVSAFAYAVALFIFFAFNEPDPFCPNLRGGGFAETCWSPL